MVSLKTPKQVANRIKMLKKQLTGLEKKKKVMAAKPKKKKAAKKPAKKKPAKRKKR